jgi:hypothetical protein
MHVYLEKHHLYFPSGYSTPQLLVSTDYKDFCYCKNYGYIRNVFSANENDKPHW